MPRTPYFEDFANEIDEEIDKQRYRWMLESIQWIDFKDVAQIIRLHIYAKWYLYDSTKAIRPWVAKIVSNQIRNLVRNVYYNKAPVCSRCPANQGNELCGIFGGIHDRRCPVYQAWTTKKQDQYNVSIPLPLENHLEEVHEAPYDHIDVERAATEIHARMLEILSGKERRAYELMFVHGMSDKEVAEKLGYPPTSSGRQAGYRVLTGLRASIIQKVRKLIYDNEEGVDLH